MSIPFFVNKPSKSLVIALSLSVLLSACSGGSHEAQLTTVDGAVTTEAPTTTVAASPSTTGAPTASTSPARNGKVDLRIGTVSPLPAKAEAYCGDVLAVDPTNQLVTIRAWVAGVTPQNAPKTYRVPVPLGTTILDIGDPTGSSDHETVRYLNTMEKHSIGVEGVTVQVNDSGVAEAIYGGRGVYAKPPFHKCSLGD